MVRSENENPQGTSLSLFPAQPSTPCLLLALNCGDYPVLIPAELFKNLCLYRRIQQIYCCFTHPRWGTDWLLYTLNRFEKCLDWNNLLLWGCVRATAWLKHFQGWLHADCFQKTTTYQEDARSMAMTGYFLSRAFSCGQGRNKIPEDLKLWEICKYRSF